MKDCDVSGCRKSSDVEIRQKQGLSLFGQSDETAVRLVGRHNRSCTTNELCI